MLGSKSLGNTLTLGPQISMMPFSMSMEAPRADTTADRRCARSRGLQASRSRPVPDIASTTTEMRKDSTTRMATGKTIPKHAERAYKPIQNTHQTHKSASKINHIKTQQTTHYTT